MLKSSQTLQEAKEKSLFKFEFVPDKLHFQLDSRLVFNIKNVWVENNWRYECIDNRAEVVKDSTYQFVIDAEYEGNAILSEYWLGNNHLGSVLRFDYAGQDTLEFALCKDTSYTLTKNSLTVDSIVFIKRLVSR